MAKPKDVERKLESLDRGAEGLSIADIIDNQLITSDKRKIGRVADIEAEWREDGTLEPGRLYVGVHAPGLGSLQTAQVRTFSALLQAPMPLPETERDPWWTLLLFFNSLRELGTTVTLFQSDIPDYLKTVRNRTGLTPAMVRNSGPIIAQ